jgi:trans-2,3-dihydro-3-hydroxyanthranilate isomerase
MTLSFYIVDVFAERKYAGNQLAVFTNGQGLSTEEMQQIAQEMNFSETTFITSPDCHDGGYDVRIFTPTRELPFAGHPTLGTAFVLQQGIIGQVVEQVKLNLKVGQIPVTIAYQDTAPDLLWMRQNPPTFGEILAGDRVASVLNLDPADLDDRFPIQEVSTGMPFVIVPLKSLSAMQRIEVNLAALRSLVAPLQAQDIFVFCPEPRSPKNHFSARVFAPLSGIAEDPATGSANGCFAGYLVHHSYLGDSPIDVSVEQGYELGRPARLLLKAHRQEDHIEVLVGGNVVTVARGEFL